ncbi:MAG TPA: hypothetical protein VK191_13210 [Symbiobacteriaceae bacterium]|nr:hypothetical protein [Symbiobacteriaceae bacterium]
MSNPGPALLRSLIAKAQQEPAVDGLWVGGSALIAPDEPFVTLQLIYAAPALPAVVGEGIALARPVDGGLQVVTEDGLDFTLRLLAPGEEPSLTAFRQVKRPAGRPAGVTPTPEPASPSLSEHLIAMGAAFWGDLYRATAAVGQGEPFTAHGHLERCRGALLALYRLAGGDLGTGWFAAEARLGAQLQQELGEWLVAPLAAEPQWRNAYRLAQRFESLMLPLAEKLKLDYPWKMRTLAFDRLGKAKPGAAAEE